MEKPCRTKQKWKEKKVACSSGQAYAEPRCATPRRATNSTYIYILSSILLHSGFILDSLQTLFKQRHIRDESNECLYFFLNAGVAKMLRRARTRPRLHFYVETVESRQRWDSIFARLYGLYKLMASCCAWSARYSLTLIARMKAKVA